MPRSTVALGQLTEPRSPSAGSLRHHTGSAGTGERDTILLVDDDPDTIQLLGRILAPLAEVKFATSGQDALRLARARAPDLILLDSEMPGLNGFQVCAALKADPLLADIPVIFVTSHSQPAFEVSGFDAGAVDFIAKPVTPQLVLARVQNQLRVKHMADELRRIGAADGLTGLINRGRFDDLLEQEWRRARRSAEPISLVMIDVDHFKLFNDRYGHPAGDTCLRSVAQALMSASLRPADVVGRYGGEEFVMLLPRTPRAGAMHVAQLVLAAVTALAIPHQGSLTAQLVTVSIGVGSYDRESSIWTSRWADTPLPRAPHPACSANGLVRAADQALYRAKRGGRAQARALDIAAHTTPASATGLPI